MSAPLSEETKLAEAQAGWSETSDRCRVLIAALKRIENYPPDHNGYASMRMREIARDALRWSEPEEWDT